MRQVFRGWGVVTETKNTPCLRYGVRTRCKIKDELHLDCEGINYYLFNSTHGGMYFLCNINKQEM